MGRRLGEELGEMFRRDAERRAGLLTLAQLGRCQEPGLFRVPLELRIILGDAPHPAILHIGIGHPEIEGIIAHRDMGPFDLGIAERIMPVIDAVDLDPLA